MPGQPHKVQQLQLQRHILHMSQQYTQHKLQQCTQHKPQQCIQHKPVPRQYTQALCPS